MSQNIIAIGGGGFSSDPVNSPFDRYLLGLTGKARPKVCFLPQASAEPPQYVVKFYETYTGLGAKPGWFSLFGRVPRDWRDMILQQDLIFVGGGNTKSMLAVWRDWGMDLVLREALENGTVLAGVSAGAICWFEECVTDSIWPLGTILGLGFLPGSACPHYDGEPERRPTLLELLKKGELIDGIAIRDHAAAHYIDGKLHKILATRPSGKAFLVSRREGEAHEEELPVEMLEVQ